MKISCVINLDTRTSKDTNDGLFNGVVNSDFLDEGVFNKVKFLEGFDYEIICYVDEHNPVTEKQLESLREYAHTLVIRKHTTEPNFNDFNYIRALSLASGDIIMHFDQDVCAFRRSKEAVEDFIKLLDTCDFVSYPSLSSPLPAHDESFDHVWVSTRFFMCKRESLDLKEIEKCQRDYDYWLKTYPVKRACHWFEHLTGSIAKYRNQSVYYPPLNIDNLFIFTWGKYERYTLQRLNNYTYDEFINWQHSHPFYYPNDIDA